MESYMHHFLTTAKHILKELKDVIVLVILVAVTAISGYQFIAWKLSH
jgi:hypothetical protein